MRLYELKLKYLNIVYSNSSGGSKVVRIEKRFFKDVAQDSHFIVYGAAIL